MGVHVIPVAIHVPGATTRQEAFEFVKRMLEQDDDSVVVKFPNDEPDGEWHLQWSAGLPPEALSEAIGFDPTTGSLYPEEGT